MKNKNWVLGPRSPYPYASADPDLKHVSMCYNTNHIKREILQNTMIQSGSVGLQNLTIRPKPFHKVKFRNQRGMCVFNTCKFFVESCKISNNYRSSRPTLLTNSPYIRHAWSLIKNLNRISFAYMHQVDININKLVLFMIQQLVVQQATLRVKLFSKFMKVELLNFVVDLTMQINCNK